ncbi:MAG: spermidine synthase [Streptosporangiaceae bacterium]
MTEHRASSTDPAEPGFRVGDGSQAGGANRVELLADLDRAGGWMLLVDGVPQSHVDLYDPRHLDFEYARRIGHLIELIAPDGVPLRVLHLGAGALTLARYVAATRPGSEQVAIDNDPELAALVRSRLPFPDDLIDLRVADARAALPGLPAASFDLVVADVFAGGSTPAHLVSAEFTAAAARVLTPAGVFAANVGDGPPLTHARRRVATIRAGFRRVCVLAEPGVLHGRRFGNLVVLGSGGELPVAGLTRRLAADPFPASVLDDERAGRFAGDHRPLTDADAEPSPAPPPEVFA